MIQSNEAVKLTISSMLKNIITYSLLGVCFLLIYFLFKSYTNDKIFGSIVELLSVAFIALGTWFYILQIKTSHGSEVLMELTHKFLSKKLPEAIARRIYYYKKNQHNEDFKSCFDGKKEIDIDIKDIDIKTNAIKGVPACSYKFILPEVSEASLSVKHLTVDVQINIYQIEITYEFKFDDESDKWDQWASDVVNIINSAMKGACRVGYTIRRDVKEDSEIKYKARMIFDNDINLLLNPSIQQFIMQDIAVMTGYLVDALRTEVIKSEVIESEVIESEVIKSEDIKSEEDVCNDLYKKVNSQPRYQLKIKTTKT